MTEGADDQKRLAAMLAFQSRESTDYLGVSVIFGQLPRRNQYDGIRINPQLFPPVAALFAQAWAKLVCIDPNWEQRCFQFLAGELLSRRRHIVAVDYQMIDQS
jgi:hypothetical protein